MIKKVYAIYDNKVGFFSNPMFMRNAAEATRTFADECNNSQSQLSVHPADFTLFEIGEYDDNSGNLIPCLPLNLGSGASFVRPKSADLSVVN